MDLSNDTNLSMDMEWDIQSSSANASVADESFSDEERFAESSDPIAEFILKLSDWCIRSRTPRDQRMNSWVS